MNSIQFFGAKHRNFKIQNIYDLDFDLSFDRPDQFAYYFEKYQFERLTIHEYDNGEEFDQKIKLKHINQSCK